MRIAVLTVVLTILALLIGGIGAQEPISFVQTLDHDTRLNRVWTVSIRFEACGIKIDRVFLATINFDGQLREWQRARTDYIQLQWTRDLITDGYTLMDLLADFGQRVYLLRVHGSSPLTDGRFVKFYWISPFGVSDTYTLKAPVRSDVSGPWKSEEVDHMTGWMMKHRWSHPQLIREFSKLTWKRDARIEIPMKFVGKNCGEARLDKEVQSAHPNRP